MLLSVQACKGDFFKKSENLFLLWGWVKQSKVDYFRNSWTAMINLVGEESKRQILQKGIVLTLLEYGRNFKNGVDSV
jgi:hypothetical protein